MDAADRDLLARSISHAMASNDGHDLDGALTELGWADALASDPRTAISLLFGHQGEANRASSALDHVVADALSQNPADVAVVFPALGDCAPPGHVNGGQLIVRGLGGVALRDRASALVVTTERDAQRVVLVAVADLDRRSVSGVDPALSLFEVTSLGSGVQGLPADPASSAAGQGWELAVSRAQLALGHELVGAGRKMLELARLHAVERIQFGRPIAGFQAVRHRLADALVAIETADAALDAAWDDTTPRSASLAKALAGRGALTAGRHAQQVLAGIGFTTEHPLHRYVRRALLLDQLFGSAGVLTRRLGEEILVSRQLPELTPL